MVTAACCMCDTSHAAFFDCSQPRVMHVRGGDSQRRSAQWRCIGMPGQCHAMPAEWPTAHCEVTQHSEYCKRPQPPVSPVCARADRHRACLFVCLSVCLFVCLFVRCSPIGLRCVGRTERVGVRVEREKQPAHLSRSGGGSMRVSPRSPCGLRLAAYGAQYCDETTHRATAASAGEHGTAV